MNGPLDLACLSGVSLFETVRVRRRHWLWLEDHMRRMEESASAWQIPWRWDGLHPEPPAGSGEDQVARISLLLAGGPWAGAPATWQCRWDFRPFHASQVAMYCATADAPLAKNDPLRLHKTGSRMAMEWPYLLARKRGFDEVLFADSEGYLLEGSRGSIFFLYQNRWITPPLSLHVLPGLFRRHVLAEGKACQEALHLNDLPGIAAAVWVNSVQGAKPVARLGDRPLALAQATPFCHSLACQTLFA